MRINKYILFIIVVSTHFCVHAQTAYQLLDSAFLYKLSNYNKSNLFATKALNIATTQHNDTLRAKANMYIGTASYLAGKHDEALNKYFEAVKIYQSIKNKNGIAETYNEIGILYLKQNKLNKAKQILYNAITIVDNNSNSRTIANSYNNLGLVFETENNLDSAAYCFKIALKNYENNKDSLGIAYSLDYLSSIYLKDKKFYESEQNLIQSLNIKQRLNDKTGVAIALNNLGELNVEKDDFQKALYYFKTAQDSARHLNFTDLEAHTYNMQALVYEKMNDYKNAFLSTQKYNELSKKILDDKRLKNIEEFEAKYNTEKKENEIAQQKLKIIRKNIMLFSLLVLILLVIVSFLLFYKKKKIQQEKIWQENRIIEEEKRSKAVLESEENERQRLARELHDGVGQLLTATKLNLSLANNSEYKEKENTLQNAINVLDDSIKEIRNISHNMVPDVLLRFGLQKAIEDFSNRINQSKKIEIIFECNNFNENSLNDASKLMLYRIIQEAVNNAIKYAEASQLNIQLSADDAEISLLMEDNGKGFDVIKANEKGGIGLKNMQLRTNYLKGKLIIDSTPKNGTTIIVEIPLS
jgi:signal transduction histidine kinase